MVETHRAPPPRCARALESRTKPASASAPPSLAGSGTVMHLRRRRHKTVHFGENLLMQVCADRAHLAALGARVPDVSFCHKAHTGLRKGDARFCCVAHHCCLAAGALVALTSSGRPKPRRERSADSHSSGGETGDKGETGGSGSASKEPKRKTKHHHHHHHHHKIHSCPYHDVAPPPEDEPDEKAIVPKKTVSPYLYIPSKLEPNVQQLFSFIESVLSAWAAEEGLTSTGEYSEPDERMVRRRKLNKYKKRTDVLNIRRIVYDVSILRGTRLLGNVRFRHYHWKGTAQTCNEAFLRKISDDDRMSLTTAVSDEEDPGESAMNSPYKGKQTGAAAASFNCTGAVRKAGFLSVKKWLLRKKHQIELARKRGWKGYWVCLKGTTLLFYPCDSREGRSVEAAPKHLIIVDGAIMQPIPEHPKRDYIFCLSTAFGDAYLFQAPCQIELENWVNSIHSACAAAFARHRGKTGTLHLLQEEIYRLEKAIESDHKLKHMADLQQSVVSDPETRAQLAVQMLQWEENLERLHCEQFRLRCYMASLQSGELPNPKSLLTHVSRGTKSTLNKLGVFTVSSFHAFICARSPSLLNNLLAGRGATKRRAPQLSRSNSGSSRRSMQMSREDGEAAVRVSLPEGTTATVGVREGMSVEEFLAAACARRSLNALEHFVRVKKRRDMEDHNYFVPHRSDLIETYLHTHEVVEVCAKILYQVELQRTTLEQMWGFSVEAELIENAERQDELCCYVSRVEDKSVAMQNGIIKGDEIMVINGAIVSDLDMMYLESVLQEELSLVMMMRSSRTEPPELTGVMRAATDDIIDSLVCPPPPSEPPVISDDMISGLIVPAPAWSKELYSPDTDAHGGDSVNTGPPKVSSRTNSFEIENLLKSAEQVTGWCRSPAETRRGSPTGSVASAAAGTPSRHLSDADKLRKVLLELVDTERAYVKHLNNLLENYLEPLKKETFLSNAEINALFGNIQEIVTFQRQFLQNLEEALEAEPNFHHFEFSNQFKNALFAVGNAFLYYVNHFKLYSSFCASHSKAQKVLHPNEGNQALQEFLAARNPKQQHSSTLESYLIKPIQRILKYPLLLQQLRNLTDVNSEEHLHLVEALKGMEKVAEHINEMQRIHEEYGAIFDHLFRQHQKSCKQPIDLSPGDLLYYGGVEWLNISDFLGKIKKGLELHAMCFVFKSAVVFLCKERLRQKKKLMGVSSKNSSNEVEIIRYQVLIPVTEVQVRASSAKDMDSHFLWELIHLRSQLQRRSEKVYVLSNSTADFRNAFLKTIRQIIRESVRNMSLPTSRPAPAPPRAPHTLDRERPKHQVQVMQGSQTLGKTKKPKTSGQRLSAGNIEVGDLSRENSQDAEEPPPEPPPEEPAFRHRSKTLGDTTEPVVKRAPPPPPPDADKCDPGCKSEGEDEQPPPPAKRGLGRTPNHLTLSTTSTLSAGSTGSQARLIQSSHQPAQYQPMTMAKDLGKQESQSLKSSPERKTSTSAPEKRIKVIRSCSGSSINRDRSPNRSVDHTSPDRDRVTKVIVCKSPNKSSLKQTKTLHRSPRGSFDQSKSPRGSIDKSRSPQQSFDGSRSPRGSIMKSRENSVDRSRSPKPVPKKGIMRTPQASFDKSPCKSPNLSRRSSKSGGEKLARLGTNSLDRMTHYSQLAKAEDKAIKMGIVVSKSTESIAKAIEHPTCVQCYLSGKKQRSPVWKPRDMSSSAGGGGGGGAGAGGAAPTTLPRSTRAAPRPHHLSASRKSLAPDHRH
uniref:SFRICE_004898 n=1 Tax=Spodoptera frugiperda TaxID=7108 RepID=A0A2H1V0M9_SPOFR